LRLSTYAIGIPAAAVAAVIAVANRRDVLFNLDPFSQSAPALAFTMPLFVLLFVALGVGILFGWFASAVTRRRK
jgi:hypothetical protein